VRPAVHRDGDDVRERKSKPPGRATRELIADVALEGLERRAQEIGAADPVLPLRGLPGAIDTASCAARSLVRRLRMMQIPRPTASADQRPCDTSSVRRRR